MPAAAVIPAPIAYIKVVAVKKLVVGLRGVVAWAPNGCLQAAALFLSKTRSALNWVGLWDLDRLL